MYYYDIYDIYSCIIQFMLDMKYIHAYFVYCYLSSKVILIIIKNKKCNQK